MDEEFDIENFPTNETAKEMLHMVSEDFYETSYVAKWLFQVMGIEWDVIKDRLDELPDQLFIETATWGLKYHEIKWGLPVKEELSYEERRRLLLEKRDYRAPMTPYKMEIFLRDITGMDVYVADIHDPTALNLTVDHPNKFKVVFLGDQTLKKDNAIELIKKLKQSHTRYEVYDRRDIVIDESEIEDIEIEGIKIAIKIPFFDLIRHNGEIRHNGQYRHNNQVRNIEEAAEFKFSVEESNEVGECAVTFLSVESYFHNGEYNHDGTAIHKTTFRREVL